ncbi:uncharacterized protein M6B38_409375 [Iris pallida]|uniref:Uncharacterized protein n=1 Tax=Iris pallida TaxID=29817 RepID=A0AAX6FNA9_IRIPA|nr:uncharacterized protein M6B38_238070 [Iris pallida]KAJ6792524.1 uncharacterized protein M6B38_238075 [Iris pallida]KAJ6817829.1 uncharacterized protein M6B38_409375 [Iris pallida]
MQLFLQLRFCTPLPSLRDGAGNIPSLDMAFHLFHSQCWDLSAWLISYKGGKYLSSLGIIYVLIIIILRLYNTFLFQCSIFLGAKCSFLSRCLRFHCHYYYPIVLICIFFFSSES